MNHNPLPDHGGANINMIEREEDWFTNKTTSKANVNSLIPAVASLTIKARPEFVVITAPHQAFALAAEKDHVQPKENLLCRRLQHKE